MSKVRQTWHHLQMGTLVVVALALLHLLYAGDGSPLPGSGHKHCQQHGLQATRQGHLLQALVNTTAYPNIKV